MQITKNHTISDIEDQIENGVAAQVVAAGFDQGQEDEIKTRFYRLWGSVVRVVHDRSTTIRAFYFVKGNDLDLFNAHYGAC
jgi:hypothetical protein